MARHFLVAFSVIIGVCLFQMEALNTTKVLFLVEAGPTDNTSTFLQKFNELNARSIFYLSPRRLNRFPRKMLEELKLLFNTARAHFGLYVEELTEEKLKTISKKDFQKLLIEQSKHVGRLLDPRLRPKLFTCGVPLSTKYKSWAKSINMQIVSSTIEKPNRDHGPENCASYYKNELEKHKGKSPAIIAFNEMSDHEVQALKLLLKKYLPQVTIEDMSTEEPEGDHGVLEVEKSKAEISKKEDLEENTGPAVVEKQEKHSEEEQANEDTETITNIDPSLSPASQFFSRYSLAFLTVFLLAGL